MKCIYIDPPYNTGNEGWVYNDAVNDPKMKRWLGQVVGKEGDEQTVKALNSPEHPYRQRLDQLFQHRVAVFEKRDLLMGAGFSYDTAQEQLSIVVMSFDSLRGRNKEDRKIYQENGNLTSFRYMMVFENKPHRWGRAPGRCAGEDPAAVTRAQKRPS